MLSNEFKDTVLNVFDNIKFFKSAAESDLKIAGEEYKKDSVVQEIILAPNTDINKTNYQVKVLISIEKTSNTSTTENLTYNQ